MIISDPYVFLILREMTKNYFETFNLTRRCRVKALTKALMNSTEGRLPRFFIRRTDRTQMFGAGLIELPELNIQRLDCTNPPQLRKKIGKLRDIFLKQIGEEEQKLVQNWQKNGSRGKKPRISATKLQTSLIAFASFSPLSRGSPCDCASYREHRSHTGDNRVLGSEDRHKVMVE